MSKLLTQEEKAKEIFQLAKELNMIPILKFYCNKSVYWSYDMLAKYGPKKIARIPNEKDKLFIFKRAYVLYETHNRKQNKHFLKERLNDWIKYYHKTNGYLAVD